MSWAKARDPFQRIEFTLHPKRGGAIKGITVLPKPKSQYPLVILLSGSGSDLLAAGPELRQIAELGLAAVSMNYNPTNQLHFDAEFTALQKYLQRQPWAQSNAVAWVVSGAAVPRTVSLVLNNPEQQPQLLVFIESQLNASFMSLFEEAPKEVSGSVRSPAFRRSGVSPAEAGTPNQSFQTGSNASAHVSGRSPAPPTILSGLGNNAMPDRKRPIRCPVLLIQREQDAPFSLETSRSLDMILSTNAGSVTIKTLPTSVREHSADRPVVIRAVAEYVATQLPLTDYAASVPSAELSTIEAERFNNAMRRAGQNRRALWSAVNSLKRLERRTAMIVIGGLEDYDLAHVPKNELIAHVKSAWKARQQFAWCRDIPLDVFERFVAGPRVYEEPLGDWRKPFFNQLKHEVKYQQSTSEAADAVWNWMRVRAQFLPGDYARERSAPAVLADRAGYCKELVVLYACLARSIGLPVRPAATVWPMMGMEHYWVEVWDAQKQGWHAFDCTAGDRSYNFPWLLRVPKAGIHAANGERGAWNAVSEKRWESFTNTVGLFYPSGEVSVRIMDKEQPAPNARVVAQCWLGPGLNDKSTAVERNSVGHAFSVAGGITDANGMVRLVLGQSAIAPYRITVDRPGETDWQWLAVQSNRSYKVTLHLDRHKPFDPAQPPPKLGSAE